MAYTHQAGHIFQSEGNGEDPLQNAERLVVTRTQRLHAVQHHDQHTGQDDGNQPLVEQSPGPCVGLKNDGVKP
jgi:hypothetical protein